ncbi:hypothetical protein BCR44DRAFT_178094 [Catenaria anguillulae PL171]|uniref:Uncharacterized protein n=1 Tax=Catenaria anguillulae PL171 TaxID=765915 RepID=A0A1Y2H7D0_9FUNG|nr:hypothetical protein BCR44DRAFT_178094 [Catenaria anguillulae PL171]
MHRPTPSLPSHLVPTRPHLSTAPPCRRPPSPLLAPSRAIRVLSTWFLALVLVLTTASTAGAAPAPNPSSPSRDANKLPPCASSYALWNRDIPAEFDMGFLSVKSGFECAGHVVGGAYARVAVYKKSEGRCYMKGVPRSSPGTLHGHRGEVLGTHRIPGHIVTSATFTSSGSGSKQSSLGDLLEPPYNWAHVFDSSAAAADDQHRNGHGMAACDLVFRQGDKFECQRFKECLDCVMYVGWNCAADEEDEQSTVGEAQKDEAVDDDSEPSTKDEQQHIEEEKEDEPDTGKTENVPVEEK